MKGLPLLSLPLILMANSTDKQESPDFRPFMVDHALEGCPENSVCASKMGEFRQKWILLLKGSSQRALKKFVADHGILTQVWTTQKHHGEEPIIVWDSPCSNHHKEGGEIFNAEIFTKNLHEASDPFLPRNALLVRGQERVAYTIPRGGLPLFVAGGKLYFNREMGNHHYMVSVTREGKLSLEKDMRIQHLPQSMVCPEKMVDDFSRSLTVPPHLYSGYRCNQIWDQGKKGFSILIYGWSCI